MPTGLGSPFCRGKSGPPALGGTEYRLMPSLSADSASEIVKFTISIPRESCTNAKAKYSSSLVPRDPSVHFYHCCSGVSTVVASASGRSIVCDTVEYMPCVGRSE